MLNAEYIVVRNRSVNGDPRLRIFKRIQFCGRKRKLFGLIRLPATFFSRPYDWNICLFVGNCCAREISTVRNGLSKVRNITIVHDLNIKVTNNLPSWCFACVYHRYLGGQRNICRRRINLPGAGRNPSALRFSHYVQFAKDIAGLNIYSIQCAPKNRQTEQSDYRRPSSNPIQPFGGSSLPSKKFLLAVTPFIIFGRQIYSRGVRNIDWRLTVLGWFLTLCGFAALGLFAVPVLAQWI